ncbi:cation:proton antiporter [Bacillus sp. 17376]|uniref:Na(+) H(+) antiporter subunit E n=1 Tax=Mesobacillus boroniphilus JCM 21738 TaxID=1294265 RepID=W4RJY2_9BACI|nr:Na+/H+ antiporter subunit E [Mesobacillus boroniphilus]ESU31218.1 cation:proton antiporter [Bacillus sp. 17376]GAE44616.1 Na(+) H(+) antiporter subunit E [Mesobacillus boroniphilus JCM 21738]
MAFQILLNFILAFVWMFLKTSYSPASFFVGYFFGLLIIYIFRRFFTSRFYLLRVVAVLNLIYIFTLELILSNIAVIKAVLRPKLNIKPGIFAFPTELTEDWEITMLSILVTLTPGTLVVDVSSDNKVLYIHAMDMNNAEEAIQSIKNTFEKAIMEVSR